MTLIPHERIKSNIHRLVCKFFFYVMKRRRRKKEASGCSDPVEVQVIQSDEFLQIHWKFIGVILVEKREMEWSV